MRLQTDSDFMIKGNAHSNPPAKSLSEVFGHQIEIKQHDYPASFYDDKGKLKFSLRNYNEPDREATINKYVDEFGGKDKAVKECYRQDKGAHKVAIDAAAKGKAGTLGCR